MEISLAPRSYQMLQLTWSATRYLFFFFFLQIFSLFPFQIFHYIFKTDGGCWLPSRGCLSIKQTQGLRHIFGRIPRDSAPCICLFMLIWTEISKDENQLNLYVGRNLIIFCLLLCRKKFLVRFFFAWRYVD